MSPATPWSARFLAFFCCLLVAACGAREAVEERSIPTVAAAADHADREGGIGGTGLEQTNRIGVFGVVTGFGSLLVNGERVVIPARLTVNSNTGAREGEDVDLGEVVAVAAVERDGALRAERAKIFHPVIGPVTEAFSTAGLLKIMDTTVTVAQDVIIVDKSTGERIAVDSLAVDDFLAVSGLWMNERVIATRITRLAIPRLASISGQMRRLDDGGAIGGTAFAGDDIRPGQFATVVGAYGPEGLRDPGISYNPLGVFSRPAGRLIVEGFLSPNPNDPGFHLSGFGLPFDGASPIPPTIGVRSVFRGSFDGDFLVDDSTALPDSSAERRDLLRP